MYYVFKEIFKNVDFEELMMMAVIWPLTIVGGIAIAVIYWVAYYLFRWLALPIIGADKYDLEKLERKVERKINDNKSDVRGLVDMHEGIYHPPKSARKPRKKTAKKASTRKKKAKK